VSNAAVGARTVGVMRAKDRKWLEHIETSSRIGSGMYPGTPCDFVPNGPANRLYRLGYISTFLPHNPVHKERWIISDEGRAALSHGASS